MKKKPFIKGYMHHFCKILDIYWCKIIYTTCTSNTDEGPEEP